jgi:hypothetical protein
LLARVTYALVLAALGTLIGGFFTKDSNVLLYVSIGLSVGAIVLVLIDAARRAREAPESAFEEAPAPATEVISDDVLEAFEEDEIEPFDDEDYEDFEEEPAPRPARRPAAGRTAKPAARAKTATRAKTAAKTSARTAAKTTAAKTSARSTAGKVLVVAGRDRYHAPGCRFVTGKDAEEITKAAAKRRGYEACSVCNPD